MYKATWEAQVQGNQRSEPVLDFPREMQGGWDEKLRDG